MGAGLSKALGKLFGNKEMRILMLGLDAAGKTSKYQTIHHHNYNQPVIHPTATSTSVGIMYA